MKPGFVFILFFLTICSCQSKFDDAIIIGSKASSLPYGQGYNWESHKHIEGTMERVIAVYYNNKVIVYIIDKDRVVTDYFFAKLIDYKQAEKIPRGTDHEIVKNKFGEPVFIYFNSDYDDRVSKGSKFDYFEYSYLQRARESLFSPYEISYIEVRFWFDASGKLMDIALSRAPP
jgi:hypothetical protein